MGKNSILIVELGGLDTKIMFLMPKMMKLQAKMLIFTTIHEIAPEDPQGINSFQKCFYRSHFFSKRNTLNTG